MKPTPIEFSEWRPDVATLDTKFASEVENVFAGVNSYLPFPSLMPFTTASLSDAGNDSYTKVLLPFTGADASTVITDTNAGGSAHVWTAVGNAQIDTASTAAGYTGALLLDGAGDWVETPDHADFTLGSSDFTIDCWFNCINPSGSIVNLAGQSNNSSSVANASSSFGLFRTSTGAIGAFVVSSTFTFYGYTGSTLFTDTLNTGWHHLAFVRNGFTLKLFIDGVQEFSTGVTGSVNNSTNKLAVGVFGEYTGLPWKGSVAGFRISVGIARWTENFTPPRVPYLNAGGRVCGLYSARTADGGWKIYAGTTTKLLSWSLAGWVDISRVVGGAYNVPLNELWSFEQFGTKLIACNINTVPQYVDVDVGGNFVVLPGSPPQAGHVKAIGDFLFLSRLASLPTGVPSGTPARIIIWSAVNDITGWTIGTNLCDMQEFPDGGPVQGIAGAEIGYVVQDRTIRTMQFLPGDTTFIFNFSRALHDRGCVSKYGFTSIGNVLYFVAEDGFYSASGQQITPIGADKVDGWFLANSDINRRDVVHCLAGVNKPRIVWATHKSSASQMYDLEIIFDWSNGRWTKASAEAQVWGLLSSVGLDLDTTGSEFNDAYLDTPPTPAALPLDSFAYIGGRPSIGAINPDGFLATLAGPNMPATLETAEVHLVPGQRAFVNEVYPLDDANAAGQISNGIREVLQGGPPVWAPPIDVEPLVGSAFIMTSARLHRFRRLIPNAATWTHAQGVAVSVQPDGDGVTS